MREVLKSLLTSTSSRHRPWQISAAVALGVLCGLLPKASLLFYALLALAYCLPIHLPLTVVTVLLLSVVTPTLQVALGDVGLHSLTHPRWSAFWLRLDAAPLVPWLGLHNTLVHGSALVGTMLLVPSYVVARFLAGAILQPVAPHLSDHASDTIFSDRESDVIPLVAADQPSELARQSAVSQLERILAHYDALEDEEPESVAAIDTGEQPARADAVIRRAARMVSLVDDILSSIDSDSSETVISNASSGHTHTRTEVPAIPRGRQSPNHFRADEAVADAAGILHPQARTSADISAVPSDLADRPGELIAAQSHAMSSVLGENRLAISEAREGEALRNLLNYLRELKKKA